MTNHDSSIKLLYKVTISLQSGVNPLSLKSIPIIPSDFNEVVLKKTRMAYLTQTQQE